VTATATEPRAGLDSRFRRRVIIGSTIVVALVAFVVWAVDRIDQLDASTQATNPIIRWEYVFVREDTPQELWDRTLEHLQLTIQAMALGFLLAAVLSAIALRFRWTLTPITVFSGFLYTIPSLALFGVLVGYTSNWTSALIALTSYTLLILVRNIVAGIEGVPPAVTDAADGIGMGRMRRLWSVEIPLALPVILTGVRVATVTTVGLVAITSIIQLGGLGSLIFDGFNDRYTTKIVLGTVLSIALAIALDLVLRVIEWVTTPWTHQRVAR